MPTPIVNADRDKEIMSQRAAGASLAAIGATHGISRQRVHAILKTAGRDSSVDPDKIEAELYAFIGDDQACRRRNDDLTPKQIELYSSLTAENGFSMEAAKKSLLSRGGSQ